eukprot:CAMPEP_0197590690 /NCGR_PEP_ID=MMETSP1326-20131121/12017_1 /TAXON_ID=1155430 /ORGANISM="Genus nov. species nov., Strain RCC2288" /LENGTH=43 /DNA_ID= /DNA_START= /DNA_END= /DNA_ORIENTATION=
MKVTTFMPATAAWGVGATSRSGMLVDGAPGHHQRLPERRTTSL